MKAHHILIGFILLIATIAGATANENTITYSLVKGDNVEGTIVIYDTTLPELELKVVSPYPEEPILLSLDVSQSKKIDDSAYSIPYNISIPRNTPIDVYKYELIPKTGMTSAKYVKINVQTGFINSLTTFFNQEIIVLNNTITIWTAFTLIMVLLALSYVIYWGWTWLME